MIRRPPRPPLFPSPPLFRSIAESDVTDACVVRQPKAYPVYDEDYRENVATIRRDLEGLYPSLHMVGRNGMHKYNRSEEHTSELQSQSNLVCRLLLEKKKANF